MTRRAGPLVLPLLVLALAGCGGNQNTVAPAGHPERAIAHLWWVMLVGAWIGFAVIVFLLFLGWWRRGTAGLPGGHGEHTATILVVVLGVAVPIVVLVSLFVWSDFFVSKSVAAPAKGSTELSVRVIGHEWWWEVRYDGSRAVTANEIHIPTHTRVQVVATTDDVIHSFWVPELNRKIDMIPGLRNRLLLEADRAGVYRGQCSEFCGLQHAHMAVEVVAQPRAQFEAWLAHNAEDARVAAGADVQRGKHVFLANACADCHQVRGTSADGTVGPDLTHLAERTTLAALTIPNTPARLAAWVRDPQHDKPGTTMPDLHLRAADERALDSYLESLR
jgi:cytochrome c oxidase subunit II